MIPQDLQRGDYVECVWLDICESGNGDTAKATLAKRTSIGRFWERKEDHGVACVVTTTTIDPEGTHDQGWCIYPEANIIDIKIIKKAPRRGRRVKQLPLAFDTSTP